MKRNILKTYQKNTLKAFGGRALKALGLTIVGVATMRSAHATTTVIGSKVALPPNNPLPADFASNASANGAGFTVSSGLFVTGTPNIGLEWGTAGPSHMVDSYATWDGRGAVIQFDFNYASPISVVFTPDPGYGVLVNKFDMDEYTGGDDGGPFNVDWSVFDSIGTLASGNWTKSPGGRDTILTGLTAGDIHLGEAVTLRFTKNSGYGSYFAIDNLAFDQVQAVPEPSTVGLAALGLGLGALAMRRRRA